MPTLEDLDDIVTKINKLTDKLRAQYLELHPNGKPDWMSQEKWNEINGIDNEGN
jgi:hypothetical protein